MSGIRAALGRLRLPVFAAPMFLVSGPALVLAACRAGIVGAFPTPNCRTPEDLERWLDQIAAAHRPADAPWAANLVVHRTNSRLPRDLELIVRFRAPIVITALGSPRAVVDAVHGYGGLVFADVNSVAFARKAADVGVDGLVLVSSGAGGHTGALAAFAFVEEVRRFWSGYVALGGAIASGRGVLAAQAMGADFGYIGTGFIATEESLADPEHKRLILECNAADLIVSKAFTGADASMLIPSIVKQGIDVASLAGKTAKMNYTGQQGMEVKPWKGIFSAGQGIGSIDRIESVAALVDRLATEYEMARARVADPARVR